MDASKNGVGQAKDGKEKAIGLAMAQIERQFGKGAIMRLGAEAAAYAVPVISTGAISLDSALGERRFTYVLLSATDCCLKGSVRAYGYNDVGPLCNGRACCLPDTA